MQDVRAWLLVRVYKRAAAPLTHLLRFSQQELGDSEFYSKGSHLAQLILGQARRIFKEFTAPLIDCSWVSELEAAVGVGDATSAWIGMQLTMMDAFKKSADQAKGWLEQQAHSAAATAAVVSVQALVGEATTASSTAASSSLPPTFNPPAVNRAFLENEEGTKRAVTESEKNKKKTSSGEAVPIQELAEALDTSFQEEESPRAT